MYVTIRRYKIAPGATAELKNRIQQEFVPIVSKLSGFVDYYWVESGKDEMFSVNIFKDRAGAEDSVRKAADYIRAHPELAKLMPNPPEIISGEAVVHHASLEAGKRAA